MKNKNLNMELDSIKQKLRDCQILESQIKILCDQNSEQLKIIEWYQQQSEQKQSDYLDQKTEQAFFLEVINTFFGLKNEEQNKSQIIISKDFQNEIKT